MCVVMMENNGEVASAGRNEIKINGIYKHLQQPLNDKNSNGESAAQSSETIKEITKCKRDVKDGDISQCPFFRSVVTNSVDNSISSENKNEILSQFSGELATSLIKDVETLCTVQGNETEEKQRKLNLQEVEIGKCNSIASLSSRNSDNESNTQLNENQLTLKDGLTVVAEHLGITYVKYKDETQMPEIIRLITKDLSEPYSIYTYRYFIHNWPQLCFLALSGSEYVGAIVCKLDVHKKVSRRGYIAMLAVDKAVRRKRIGTTLVKTAIEAMDRDICDEVVLETEVSNKPALQLYENLGFVRDKRLFRYYLNGVDALRLKLWLR